MVPGLRERAQEAEELVVAAERAVAVEEVPPAAAWAAKGASPRDRPANASARPAANSSRTSEALPVRA